jgi:hypothetical protein
MINGRYDFIHSREYRDGMFKLLGTNAADKKIVIYDAGLWGFPGNQFIKEMADWLDKYLGPIKPGLTENQ